MHLATLLLEAEQFLGLPTAALALLSLRALRRERGERALLLSTITRLGRANVLLNQPSAPRLRAESSTDPRGYVELAFVMSNPDDATTNPVGAIVERMAEDHRDVFSVDDLPVTSDVRDRIREDVRAIGGNPDRLSRSH